LLKFKDDNFLLFSISEIIALILSCFKLFKFLEPKCNLKPKKDFNSSSAFEIFSLQKHIMLIL